MSNIDRLLRSARAIIESHDLPDFGLYMKNLQLLFAQCRHDEIFRLAQAKWDEELRSIDLYWDTYMIDGCIGVDAIEFGWSLWIGEDQRNNKDNSYFWGMGGREIEGDDSFACEFYEFMEENLQLINDDRLYE